MPVVRQVDSKASPPRYVRMPYRPQDYTVPAGWIDEVRANYSRYPFEELLADPQGPFGSFSKSDVVHDGKRFVRLLRTGSQEYAIDVEVTDTTFGELREVPPDEVWELMRALDANRSPPVEVGAVDTNKMF